MAKRELSRPVLWIAALLTALSLVTQPVSAQEETAPEPAPQEDLPQELQNLTWSAPADIVYPLQQTLVRGMLPVLHKGADGKPVLSLVQLADGKLLWTARLGEAPAAVNANDSMVIVATGSRVLGLNLSDGQAAWQQPVQGRLDNGWQTPPQFAQIQWFADLYTVGQGMGGIIYCYRDKVYITCNGSIYALDAATGKNLWDAEYGFSLHYPLAACGDVICSSSDLGLTGYDIGSGNLAWERKDIPRATPLFSLNDALYAQTDRALLKVNPNDGSTVWEAAVPGGGAENVQLIAERLVVRRPESVWVLDDSSGSTIWAAETGGQQSVVGGERIYLRSSKGGDIFCYSVGAGKYLWNKPAPAAGLARLFCGAGIVAAINGFEVQAYNADDGRTLWRRRAPGGSLMDTNTFGANTNSIFFKSNNILAGCGSLGGAWNVAVRGNFFFVSWMWTNDAGLFVHCGAPGGATIGGLIIRPQQNQ